MSDDIWLELFTAWYNVIVGLALFFCALLERSVQTIGQKGLPLRCETTAGIGILLHPRLQEPRK